MFYFLNQQWFLYLSLVLLLQCASIKADTVKSELSLSNAIKKTLAKNPDLKIFNFRHKILRGEYQTANLKPVYELSVEAENFSGSGSLSSFDSAELSVSLSSVIELGDKRRARANVVNNENQQLKAQRQVKALELFGEVTRRFIDVLAAQSRVLLAEEAIQLADDTLFEVNKRSRAGAIPEAEVKRAQAAAGQARLTVSSEKQQLNYFKVALVALWGEHNPSFTTVSGSLFHFSEDVEFNKLFQRVKQNPAIQIFVSEQRLRDAQLRLAKTQASSNIRWSVGLRQFQDTMDTAVTAGFTVPLFSASRSKGLVASAQAQSNSVAIRKETILLKLHTQLFQAYSNRQQAIFTLKKLQSTIIPFLEEALKETQAAYQRGRYSYLDYLTARQELIASRRTLIEAAAAALRYGADIEQLTAEPLLASQYKSLSEYPGLSQ
ncbi:Heavy metal RND efflux outer membrane protein, CzcC family [hydrothermal vent metagenome]|uniref:Heavy metal RND efflux outer membrane protein, CzcC family n=1 Tax=hydrothermal vent metagenome TaxID=652676 RepID=A0A3B0ZZY2_9ZZZZ